MLKFSKNYSKSLRKYLSNEPSDWIKDSESLKCETNITKSTINNASTKIPETTVPLQCLSNFWRTFQLILINSEVNFRLAWSKNYVIPDTAVTAAVNTQVGNPAVPAINTALILQ